MSIERCNFVILDAARMLGNINTAIELAGESDALSAEDENDILRSISPYLMPCPAKSKLANWLLEEGWGNSWGIYLQSNAGMNELKKHFKKFLIVRTEDNLELFFRYYDPRVLRIFIPTCDTNQLREFFGPVSFFAMEDADPDYCQVFSFSNGILQNTRLNKQAMLSGKASVQTSQEVSENKPNPAVKQESAKRPAGRHLFSFSADDPAPDPHMGARETPEPPTTANDPDRVVPPENPHTKDNPRKPGKGFSFFVDE